MKKLWKGSYKEKSSYEKVMASYENMYSTISDNPFQIAVLKISVN